MWRERTFSVGKFKRSKVPETYGTRQIFGGSCSNIYVHESQACPFVGVRRTKLHTSPCVNTVAFSTTQSHSAALKITVRIISLRFKKKSLNFAFRKNTTAGYLQTVGICISKSVSDMYKRKLLQSMTAKCI